MQDAQPLKCLELLPFLHTFKINGRPHPSFLKKMNGAFHYANTPQWVVTLLTHHRVGSSSRISSASQAAGFPEVLSSGPRRPPFLSPSAHKCSLRWLRQPAASLGEACPGLPATCRLQAGVALGRHRRANSGCGRFQRDKVLPDLPSISVGPGVSALVTRLFIWLSCRRDHPVCRGLQSDREGPGWSVWGWVPGRVPGAVARGLVLG